MLFRVASLPSGLTKTYPPQSMELHGYAQAFGGQCIVDVGFFSYAQGFPECFKYIALDKPVYRQTIIARIVQRVASVPRTHPVNKPKLIQPSYPEISIPSQVKSRKFRYLLLRNEFVFTHGRLYDLKDPEILICQLTKHSNRNVRRRHNALKNGDSLLKIERSTSPRSVSSFE